MDFTIKRLELMNGINTVSKAVSSKDTLPILGCILLDASKKGLRLTGNDLEMAVETSYIQAEINKYGQVAVEAKMFADIIKKLPKDDVIIQVDHNFVTLIKAGKSEFKINGYNGQEFPNIPHVDRLEYTEIEQSKMKNMIKNTVFGISHVDSKPVLTGVLFDVSEGMLNVVAVDGFRVCFNSTDMDTSIVKKIVIPGKPVNDIGKLLKDNGPVKIYFTDRHVLFELEDCIVTSRLLEGEFIDYKKVLNTNRDIVVKTERLALLDTLERVSLLYDQNNKYPIKIKLHANNLFASGICEKGTVHEDLKVSLEGSSLEIYFNPRYLMEALKAIEDDEIEMLFTTSLAPCIIKGIDKESYKYLVLPLRLKS